MLRRWAIRFLAVWIASGAIAGRRVRAEEEASDDDRPSAPALSILVMDPLAKELACDCVEGFAQRRYEALAMVLERRLGRPCTSICGTKLAAYWTERSPVHLIVGKHSDVLYQARQLGRPVYPIASLTNKRGETTLRGLFVVRSGNSARSLADLNGYRIVLGPASCSEKHAAALAALRTADVEVSDGDRQQIAATCTDAANQLMAADDDEAIAAVMSDYAHALLEGCHAVPRGSLRVIGKTEPVRFISVFATDELDTDLRVRIRRELLAANRLPSLRKLLESKDGFKAIAEPDQATGLRSGWPDFRGPDRNGLARQLPDDLDRMRTAWLAPLEDRGLGGVAATEQWVAVTDRDPASGTDRLKVFDARVGSCMLIANLVRPAGSTPDRPIDYGESIRATPVIYDGRVFVLDAYGALFVVRLPQAAALPQERTVQGLRTGALIDECRLATWGVAATPLIVDQKLIANVCGTNTSLLALSLDRLAPLWKAPGKGTGYASCIAGRFGGRRQVVGYQSDSLSGWELDSGKRLWSVRPERDGDYNVPTPVAVDERHVLVATENNAMRLYRFDQRGILLPEPIAANEEVAPDTVTPVVVGGFAYCTSDDALFRLDLQHGLQSDWSTRDDVFVDHVSLIADRRGTRLMVVAYSGELLLWDISGAAPRMMARRRPLGLSGEEEIYSHPAVVANRLYLRGGNALVCVVF